MGEHPHSGGGKTYFCEKARNCWVFVGVSAGEYWLGPGGLTLGGLTFVYIDQTFADCVFDQLG